MTGGKKKKSNPSKTVLVIVCGFLVIYLALHQDWALKVALITGIAAALSDYLAEKIDWLWMKLTWLLSLIVPNILLSVIFFLFLTPIALISRLFKKKDPLFLKSSAGSLFKDTNKSFDKSTFENPW
jgi:hypothetical protein